MPRIVKPIPPRVPLTVYLHLDQRVYDAVTTHAFRQNISICQAVAFFVEAGLYDYFRYDSELKARFDLFPDPIPSPFPPCAGLLTQSEG